MKYILTYFGSNILLGVILIALGFTVFIHLIKKIPLGVLSVFAIILFILIFIFSPDLNLANTSIQKGQDSNIANIDESLSNITNIKYSNLKPILQCSDNTDYNSCSSNKPNYCDNGYLIEKPILCGCADGFTLEGDNCVSIYATNPKDITLAYILRGSKGSIDYTVYRGLNDYLAGLDRTVSYYLVPPTDEYMTVRFVTEEHQSNYIIPLVEKIKKITNNTDDQARIAISIVQTMPYDWDSFSNSSENRYAYETLYDQTGVCADKTSLLAVLLKELGYGVVIFNFPSESHEAIGIKCPMEYSYINSGYCFIESVSPTIVTDSEEEYIGAGKLTSTPEIYIVNDGKSFDSVKEEYDDYSRYKFLQAKLDTYGSGQVLEENVYNEWKKYYDEWDSITKKYGFIFDDQPEADVDVSDYSIYDEYEKCTADKLIKLGYTDGLDCIQYSSGSICENIDRYNAEVDARNECGDGNPNFPVYIKKFKFT